MSIDLPLWVIFHVQAWQDLLAMKWHSAQLPLRHQAEWLNWTMQIRPYDESDAPATLSVFLSAITETAAIDYAPQQTEAWSRPQERDVHQWNSARLSLNTIVAAIGGEVAGFSDVSESGYIDMMFVAPRFGRQGVASALLSHLHGRAVADGVSELWTHASITARPFFERHGFVVAAERHPITHGVRRVNYRMTRQLVP